ncbi:MULTISPECIES: OmpP1/FadL family transporter [Thiomicrorhabdus]|uniref:Outer membrane protein transport protein n=1 Tax=Thiomicrorhabdus heinhorstiae TaxID=2748010 RepID=A0ABS0BX33_9GAMM|nr:MULTISPECIES: outer membrane protein transport protein [Thiomicrorhabdus]MBF6057954.1 outer membrane protein transport protein [Thiomicrorhabdus heinhorstiae]
MKKTRLALALATATFASTPVWATNGDVLIGLGAQARALGGTGTAAFFGSENALTNPALLAKSQGSEFSIGGTIFKPDVKAEATTFGPASQTSDNDLNIIPEVSLSTRLSDTMTFGLGIFGSAGMGVDYRDTNGLINGYSNLQIMKFVPSIAINQDNFGIGFAPVIQYGALDINYRLDMDQNGTTETNVGNGMSTDLGFGFNLGGYIDVTPELTLAMAYQSAINMKYKNQMSVASQPFVNMGVFSSPFGDSLEQPAEIKLGVAYEKGSMLYTFDYKNIKWGDAKGYKDFNWKDQNVFAMGAKYSGQGYWFGVGYNKADDPIDVLADTSPANQGINFFNNHFFPGIVESHFTLGGGYNLTKTIALDGAIVYAPEVTKTVNTGFLSQQANPSATTEKVTHSQIGYTISLRMNF